MSYIKKKQRIEGNLFLYDVVTSNDRVEVEATSDADALVKADSYVYPVGEKVEKKKKKK